MALDVMAVVLFAALLHAGWNALVRSSQDTFADTVFMVGGAALWAACLLPLLPLPAPASWPWLGASVLVTSSSTSHWWHSPTAAASWVWPIR
ncbi:hypothetical protein [Methyloversatilis sp.]|uniref:hypothetical protein n=1 Tax=Methyloversatilis sp. TaxID=2569862 RepID=UPI003D2BD811